MKSIYAAVYFLAAFCFSSLFGQGADRVEKVDHQLMSFWKNELELLLQMNVLSGRLPFSEVNKRFEESQAEIVRAFGRSLKYDIVWVSHPLGDQIECMANVSFDGKTTSVSFFLPALRETFERAKASGIQNWRQVFANHVVLVFMRELERIRYVLGKDSKGPNLEDESRVWSLACRHVLFPMIEGYKAPFFPAEENMFRIWLRANGEEDDPAWRTLMAQMYRTDKK